MIRKLMIAACMLILPVTVMTTSHGNALHGFAVSKETLTVGQESAKAIKLSRGDRYAYIGALDTSKPIGPLPVAHTPASKGTRFATPDGNGNSCEETRPCSIYTAVENASPGDTVFLRGGVYKITNNVNAWQTSTKDNPLIIESYPGEVAILDGSEIAPGGTARLTLSGDFIHARKFEVRKMPKQGILVLGNDNIVEGVTAYENHLSGIQIFSPYNEFPYGEYGSRNIIRNCISHSNSDAGLLSQTFADGGNADGLSASSGAFNRLENNLVYGNSDDGIDTSRSTDSYVGYNIVHSSGLASGDGNGIKAGGPEPSNKTNVAHNLSYNNRAVGITHNSGKNVTFFKNTVWDNGRAPFTFGDDTVAESNIAAGHIIDRDGSQTNNSWQLDSEIVFIDYNGLDVPVAKTQQGTTLAYSIDLGDGIALNTDQSKILPYPFDQ